MVVLRPPQALAFALALCVSCAEPRRPDETATAASAPATASATAPRVRVGIDVLETRGFDVLAGRKIGLITNLTGKDARGERTIDVLAASKSFHLVALFSPEHGLGADKDALVPSGKDTRTGLPIHSLYRADRRPTPRAPTPARLARASRSRSWTLRGSSPCV